MKKPKPNTPAAFKIALLNLAAGTVGLVATLLLHSATAGTSEICIGFILLGLGEYINNPQYNTPHRNSDSQDKLSSYLSRRRNVSSLGNLLDIAGVLMLSIGTATHFF